jgi:hypothetical protein
MPDIKIKYDTTFISYTDTIKVTNTRVKFDTLTVLDSIFITQADTLYRINYNELIMPYNLGNGLYITQPFELSFEFHERKDTIIPTFYFPNMIAEVIWKHSSDSISYVYNTIYKDYWYNNIYVEIAKDLILITGGYLLSNIGEATK